MRNDPFNDPFFQSFNNQIEKTKRVTFWFAVTFVLIGTTILGTLAWIIAHFLGKVW